MTRGRMWRVGRRPSLGAAALLAAAIAACGGTARAPSGAAAGEAGAAAVAARDTAGLPSGFGSLRQEDLALTLRLPGVLVRALPLDERVLRVLSPDSERALRELRASRDDRLEPLARRYALRERNVWYISWFGLQDGARFSPDEVVITSLGRDFRPLEVIPLSAGFGTQRLDAREVRSALYVFEDGLDIEQPLIVRVETAETAEWAATLRTIARERALVRSRAGRS
ncbi:MAG TPA: hypothetical protein VFZ11_04860 [Gemmatimonadaceae bacterium]